VADPIPGFERVKSMRARHALPSLKRQVLSGQRVDLDEVCGDLRRRWILLAHGYFQRYEYFRLYAEQIRGDWLEMPRLHLLEPRSITIHIRSTDLWESRAHPDYVGLPYSYYKRLLDVGGYERVYVVTDEPTDPMVRKLHANFDATVRSGTAVDDFNFLVCSENLVLSVSTFSWWAAWLSGAREVHYPVAGHFDPEVAKDVDLIVDDEDRYLFHRPAVIHPWRGTAEDRRRLLES
jgi:hypothetical protein